MKLSIVIPVFNEVQTVAEVVRRASESPIGMEREIVVVDDGSTDGTSELLRILEAELPRTGGTTVLCRYSTQNRGKGSAIRIGLAAATGDIILFQDADLELDPAEYPKLLAPILSGRTKVVYGRRSYWSVPGSHWTSRTANGLLAVLTSILYGQVILDMETAYKVMRREAISPLRLESDGFAIEPEITAKLRRTGHRILEVPIDYRPRSVSEGKKIRWKDGLVAIWRLFKFRFVPQSRILEAADTAPSKEFLTTRRVLSAGLALLLLISLLMVGIVRLASPTRETDEVVVSRGSGSLMADSQVDTLDIGKDGSCVWQRWLTVENRGRQNAVEIYSRFPQLAMRPFTGRDPENRGIRVSAKPDRWGLNVYVTPLPPIVPGETRRVGLWTEIPGMVRTKFSGDKTARLSLPARQLMAEAEAASLVVRLPGEIPDNSLTPVGIPWDSVSRGSTGTALVWRDLRDRLPGEQVGVEVPVALLPGRLPADVPVTVSRLAAAASGLALLTLAVFFVAWRGPPSWHEPALLAAMGLQFFLFFQPMLLEDNMAYHSYARNLWRDGSLDMVVAYKLYNTHGIYAPNPLEPVGPTGASVMLAPFYVLGSAFREVLARAGHFYPANGFSWPYLTMVGAGDFLYVCWGLIFSYRMARETAGPRLALAATLAVAWGTNLVLITSFWTASTHAPSFFLVTAFVYLWWRSREERSSATWGLLGILGGLATQTRYQNGAFLILPILDTAVRFWQAEEPERRRLGAAGLYAYVAGTLLGLSAQILLWWCLEGSPVVDNYGVGKHRFGDTLARFWKLLFGRKEFGDTDGIFVSMPLLAPAWLALVVRWQRLRVEERELTLMLLLQLGVVASYETFWGKLLYGSAYLVNCSAITVLGLARALQWAGSRPGMRRLLGLVLIAACLYHLRFEIKQQAFEQMSRSGGTSTGEKLSHLWFLSPAIELGYTRKQSGEFGCPFREILSGSEDAVPIAMAGLSLALMATLVLGRVSAPRTRTVLFLLTAYLVCVDAVALKGARAPRTFTYHKISASNQTVYDYKPASRATGALDLGPVEQSLFQKVIVVSHLIGAEELADGTPVGEVLIETDKQTIRFTLKAGEDTAEGSAMRPETRDRVRHQVPLDRIVHQWRTRDGSAQYYWAYSFARLETFAKPTAVKKIELHPLLEKGFIVVPSVLFLGPKKMKSDGPLVPAGPDASGRGTHEGRASDFR